MIYLIIMSVTFTIFLSMLLNFMATFLSYKTIEDQEKMSPFECGFDPMKSSRMPFSLRFFLITIIFLIFDVEITFILPMILNFNKSNMLLWIFIIFVFILILILGLLHEWNQGALEWSK
uniref:NADH-ubiquinone oxidoreductase chain 3 n=1 Tax=Lepidopsocidae sp. RS-2001 TaxID=159971 RepID=Q94XD5_9NEOP|nr:NADH dehydrogenase subunit 3 [Lepidopsocidae sp. RS-2001]AAK55294.2 NADH dehydrogenase subunit 3 [Lepidopsocidae sp. RS-2001]